MPDYVVSPEARRDLFEIWDYTEETWGTAQAERYVAQLFAAFARLADRPGLGRARDDIRPGYRLHVESKHIIFYRAAGNPAIEVIRVLHQRMLPVRHM